jgi:hypothetical protein
MRNTGRQTRENRTITVDFHNETTYYQLLGGGKAFVEESREILGVRPPAVSPQSSCPSPDTSA